MARRTVVILTAGETRHTYFRMKIAAQSHIDVLASFCESNEQSLTNRTSENEASSALQNFHAQARAKSETDFFGDAVAAMQDRSKPITVKKGAINDTACVEEIIRLSPDLLVCYGSSLIRSELLQKFRGRFLNAHLGLSPYYRGSGTNVWPLINREPHMVGVTFMHLDEGIDTGEIIHQIRADVCLGDSPHSIGNRLIRKMTACYADLINRFEHLKPQAQPQAQGRLYLRKHFDEAACAALYRNLGSTMLADYLTSKDTMHLPYIVQNAGMETAS
jgi:phosphoribosylglycinamide formyltransferase 1